MKCLEPGVMEYWSIGVSRDDIKPSDITPVLQHSEIKKQLKAHKLVKSDANFQMSTQGTGVFSRKLHGGCARQAPSCLSGDIAL